MNIFIFITISFISAILFALTEIQIEGKNGWASALPTWKKSFQGRGLLKIFINKNRPQTGYHLYIFLFLFTFLHFIYALQPISITTEFYLILFFLITVSLEDFLWFVLNPHFGLKKFKPQYIPWHTSWFLGVPTSYYFSLFGIALLLLAISQL